MFCYDYKEWVTFIRINFGEVTWYIKGEKQDLENSEILSHIFKKYKLEKGKLFVLKEKRYEKINSTCQYLFIYFLLT